MIVCYPTSKPSVSAVLIGFHGINLFKNLVSWELLRIFTSRSRSILISLFTSRKRVKAFFSLCTSRTSKTHSRWSLGRLLGSDHEQMWKLSVFFSLLNPVSKKNISFTWCVKKRPQCNGDACWFNHPYIDISSNINQIDNFSILQFRLHSQVFAENVAIYAFFSGKIIRLRILLV